MRTITVAAAFIVILSGCGGSSDAVVLASAQERPQSVAIRGGRIFWINGEDGRASIRSTAADGSEPAPSLLMNNRPARALVVDDQSAYWTEASGNGYVRACSVDGCDNEPPIVAALDNLPRSIAMDDENLYWFEGVSQAIRTCPKTGCKTPRTIAITSGFDAEIAVADGNIYWTDEDAGTVSQCPVSGCDGSPVRLAELQIAPRSIAVGAGTVYWASWSAAGTIQHCPTTGCVGKPEHLATGQRFPVALHLDGDTLYWSTDEGIRTCRASVCEDDPQLLVADRASSIATDSRNVYWSTFGDYDGKIMKLAK